MASTAVDQSTAGAGVDDSAGVKLTLRSKTDSAFTIEVGSHVIEACSILKNVAEHTDNSDAVEVDMTPKQLEDFVKLHDHFKSKPAGEKDLEFTNGFFKAMSDAEFKDLCWKADYLDSQRFLEAAGDFVLAKLEELEVKDIQNFLNIVDDYTPDERKAMEEHPLEFFTGVSIQQDEESAAKA